jgi:hypothetical protein
VCVCMCVCREKCTPPKRGGESTGYLPLKKKLSFEGDTQHTTHKGYVLPTTHDTHSPPTPRTRLSLGSQTEPHKTHTHTRYTRHPQPPYPTHPRDPRWPNPPPVLDAPESSWFRPFSATPTTRSTPWFFVVVWNRGTQRLNGLGGGEPG